MSTVDHGLGLNLGDLDLLDDEFEHAVCQVCQPARAHRGAAYVALCGRRMVAFKLTVAPEYNPCPDCSAALHRPCAGCGGRFE
ncbi:MULTISPECIES: hypothetical protein [unclassified Nocardioides]|uniref:hypothetical protein n=1 Tax=unclassified Nocardioides TaxID=2615069 RepID=UPI0005A1C384|nr:MULTISPECIES: hypothetical protein [unclassified Nocardioides]